MFNPFEPDFDIDVVTEIDLAQFDEKTEVVETPEWLINVCACDTDYLPVFGG